MRPRPRVDLLAPVPPQEVLDRFRERLDATECPCDGSVGQRELSLVLRGEARHVFSPWISLEVRPHDRGALLSGRFGPHPNLWALFVLIYATLLFTGIAGTTYGFVQWTLGQEATGLWIGAAGFGALGLACGVDLTGRRVGQPQMATIHAFVEQVVPEGEVVDGHAP